jgi:hypothetical protein
LPSSIANARQWLNCVGAPWQRVCDQLRDDDSRRGLYVWGRRLYYGRACRRDLPHQHHKRADHRGRSPRQSTKASLASSFSRWCSSRQDYEDRASTISRVGSALHRHGSGLPTWQGSSLLNSQRDARPPSLNTTSAQRRFQPAASRMVVIIGVILRHLPHCSSGITRLIVIWPPNSKGALFGRIFHPYVSWSRANIQASEGSNFSVPRVKPAGWVKRSLRCAGL